MYFFVKDAVFVIGNIVKDEKGTTQYLLMTPENNG
jgi:hypothetical protein